MEFSAKCGLGLLSLCGFKVNWRDKKRKAKRNAPLHSYKVLNFFFTTNG